MFFVYALNNLVRNYVYIGLTNNVKKRVTQHQLGKERTTAPYRPFELLLEEEFKTRAEARRREKYLKSGSGQEKLKRKANKCSN